MEEKQNYIVVKGARENNLKNINVKLPKNSLIVFSGLSGSGKSTLAFDTIYAEGQRRYVESLSSYARQFLGSFEKPDVDSIEGLSPAISIEQKTTSNNPRSTVGTVTEIYDYLRLLFARIGKAYCPHHNKKIESFSVSKMVDIAFNNPINSKLMILSPIIKNEKGSLKNTLKDLQSDGYERIRIDGEFKLISEIGELDKNKRHNLDIVIDRVIIKPENRARIFESIELSTDLSKGYVILYIDGNERLLSEHNTCDICGFSVPKLEPRLFSFNAPMGCCPDCKGLSIKKEADFNRLVPDKNKSINQGAIEIYKSIVNTQNLDWQTFDVLLKTYNIDKDKPIKDFTKEELDILCYGSKEEIRYKITASSGNTKNRFEKIPGILNKVENWYASTESEMMRTYLEKFIRDKECTTCHGARLSKEVLAIKVDGLNIYEVTKLSLDKLLSWIKSLRNKLSKEDLEIVKLVLNEIENRVKFLCDVGLEYLDLARMASTLSGGEAQRIRLATQIGCKLSGVLYVLDEPSIGLHQRDNDKLITTLKEMVNLGNTLIVVEHDEDTIRSADYIVDIGPGAGVHGGEVVCAGTLNEILKCENSYTVDYLTGKRKIVIPPFRKKIDKKKLISLKGCRVNNLKNIDVDFPLGLFICVAGVSGSGKSSLVNETLYKAIRKEIYKEDIDVGEYKSISGLENIDKVINITQEPIGRTPRSNPATYLKIFDNIRELFAETKYAKEKGYTKSRFSFNLSGGRCESCWGDGVKRIPMNFLPDVYVTCDECNGKRYNEETLKCEYKGKNIYDVLEMTIEDAKEFFKNRESIYKGFKILCDVGLGYMKVGQAATTLSGGEAQRVKLANELQRRSTGKTLYILDEPTTGLHSEDIRRLLDILISIVNNGDTVIVIEHNLDVIKMADYIIDIGPEGGEKGGRVIAKGTPEEIVNINESYTGKYLKKYLNK